MSGDLGLLSSTQLQNLHHQDLNRPISSSPSSGALMWNTHLMGAGGGNEDDSWEVRAFAEDTGAAIGTTWPPRSYTCTFCSREFRSAQALGGHMNVHRRDRARLRQSMPEPSPASTNPLVFPTQEFVAGGGSLCLLYAFPPHGNNVFSSPPANGYNLESPSTHLSMAHCAPYTSTNKAITSSTTSFGFPPAMDVETKALTNGSDSGGGYRKEKKGNQEAPMAEELDLELRLGQRSP